MIPYHSEHIRMKPVLDKARAYDIATNPDPRAVFEAGGSGFQIWCTPDDCPRGWEGLKLSAGCFSKPCGYVASVRWGWGVDEQEGQITHLVLSTTAYTLADQKPEQFTRYSFAKTRKGARPVSILDRPADISWAKNKIRWLFRQARVACPPIIVGRDE